MTKRILSAILLLIIPIQAWSENLTWDDDNKLIEEFDLFGAIA